MIKKVTISDIAKTPIPYVSEMGYLQDKVFDFKPGVNIIVGPNGSGKTTLLQLIQAYLLIDNGGQSPHLVKKLYRFNGKFMDDFCGGVDVVSDYTVKSFKMNHTLEMTSDDQQKDFLSFGQTLSSAKSSTGEGVVVALNTLFKKMFSDTDLNFPLLQAIDGHKEYKEYIIRNRFQPTQEDWEVTIFMDEPDRNLDILNIDQVLDVLKHRKEHTQVIAVVHNPLLIYSLYKSGAYIIEMEEGYLDKVVKKIKKLTK